MGETADAVVVGGGVMGCSILYNLAARGVTNAVLLEKATLASGSTSRSQAILRMHYSNEVTTRMAWESLKVFQDFPEMTGTPSGYVRTGYFLIVGQEDRRALEENVAMQKTVGVETDVVSVKDVLEIAPMLAVSQDEVFAYEPQSGYADPYSVTTGYARRAREMGAQVRPNTPVTTIEVRGGRVAAVATPEGRIETPVAVVAAGPWSGPLLEKLGVDVPLRPLRHQVVMLRRPEDLVPGAPHHRGRGVRPLGAPRCRQPDPGGRGGGGVRGARRVQPGRGHVHGPEGLREPGQAYAGHVPGPVQGRLVGAVHHHARLASCPGPGRGYRGALLRGGVQRPRLQAIAHDRRGHG